jgi:hypothetical protein
MSTRIQLSVLEMERHNKLRRANRAARFFIFLRLVWPEVLAPSFVN